MTDALRLTSLSKSYSKNTFAVQDMSFSVQRGEFKALLGPNGSGKSTILKMCCNLLDPTSGKVEFNGIDVRDDPAEALSHMGCVIETPELYRDRIVSESLEYICMLRGMNRETARSESFLALEKVGMTTSASQKFGKMSKGMKQRVVLAQALVGNPDILILDEPSSGLDPAGMNEMEEIIKRLNKDGMSILMSSHMLHEVERMCDNYVFIRKGHKISEGSIKSVNSNHVTVRFTRPLTEPELSQIQSVIEVLSNDRKSITASVKDDESRSDLLRKMILSDLPVCDFTSESGLEDMFMDVEGYYE